MASAGGEQARSAGRVHQRHLGDRPRDAQPGRALGPLSRLDARAESGWRMPVGPVSVPEQVFPEQSFYTWNSIGPRVGITYDLAGDGKTVLQGQLRPVLAQPGPGRQRRRQPEPEQQERHLHLERHQRRPPLPARAKQGDIDQQRRWRARSSSIPNSAPALLARRHGVSRAPARADARRARRLRLQVGRRPDRAVQPGPPGLGLHRAVLRLSTSAPTARRHGRRSVADALRRALGQRGGAVPAHQRHDEPAALRRATRRSRRR